MMDVPRYHGDYKWEKVYRFHVTAEVDTSMAYLEDRMILDSHILAPTVEDAMVTIRMEVREWVSIVDFVTIRIMGHSGKYTQRYQGLNERFADSHEVTQ